MMLIMMMAFLRESEAVALKEEDVTIKTEMVNGAPLRVLQIFVVRSKTDKASEGAVILLGENRTDPSLCPLRRYEIYRQRCAEREQKSVHFFPTIKGDAMGSTTPCGIVQRAVAQANALAVQNGFVGDKWGDPMAYGSHSMRGGGVTVARANGVSMLDIQRHGRWKSLIVFSYVGSTVAEQLAVTTAFLANAAPTTTVSDNETSSATPSRSCSAPLVVINDVIPDSSMQLMRAASRSSDSGNQSTSAGELTDDRERISTKRRRAATVSSKGSRVKRSAIRSATESDEGKGKTNTVRRKRSKKERNAKHESSAESDDEDEDDEEEEQLFEAMMRQSDEDEAEPSVEPTSSRVTRLSLRSSSISGKK